MNEETKMQAIEYLRSMAIQSHEAILAIRENNYGNASELLEDIEADLKKVEEALENATKL